jgi:hypothetical protein
MRAFCQVIELPNRDGCSGGYAVVAASAFTSVPGHCLAHFIEEYRAQQYAERVNTLARVYRRRRAAAAKDAA